MQDERDYLMKRTFPKLRKLASERDVTLTELDLRWGITDEESRSGKVVEICLQEIENSIPFFIGIIGNRYGWVPGVNDLGGNVTERFSEVEEYIQRGLSVTEMEMQFGVLERKEDMHAFFYIKKHEEKQDNPEMLKRLKQAVLDSRYPVEYYCSPEHLAEQVEKSFTKLLDQLFPEGEISDLDKERIGQRSFMNSLCQNYIKDQHNFDVIDEWMKDWKTHQLVITGASGIGKSALIANWVKAKLGNDLDTRYNIIYHFTGNGGSQSNKEHISKSICSEINDIYGWKNNAEYRLDIILPKVSSEGNKPLLIVLDAINQIIDTDDAKLMNWLPAIPDNVKVLFSTLNDDRTMEAFKNMNFPIFTLPPLNLERRKQLVNNYLSMFSKKLTEAQVNRIITNRQCENTLVLKTLLDELINFGSYELLDEKIEYHLRAESVEDFYHSVLQSYEDEFGRAFVAHTLSLICVSHDGLFEDQIMSILNPSMDDPAITPLLWSQFYCSFFTHITSKSGKITFSHTNIRNSVSTRYLESNKKFENECRFEILRNVTANYGAQTFFEQPYQLYKIGSDEALEQLYDYVSNPHVAITLYRKDRANVIEYWNTLKKHGYKFDVYKETEFSESDEKTNQWMTFEFTSFLNLFGEHEIATEIAEKKLNKFLEGEAIDNELLAKAYNDAANSYRSDSKNENIQKALNYYCKAVDLLKGTKSLELGNAYNGLAILLLRAKEGALAVKFGNKALELSRSGYGSLHQEVATHLNTVAQGYELTGDWEKAKMSYNEAISIIVSLNGIRSEELAKCCYNYAAGALDHHEYKSAQKFIAMGIEAIINTFGYDYYDYPSYISLQKEINAGLEASSCCEE